MTKLFISQPMRGRRMADIVRERKTLVADAAVALQEDEIMVLDTLFDDTDAPPLALLAACAAVATVAVFARTRAEIFLILTGELPRTLRPVHPPAFCAQHSSTAA